MPARFLGQLYPVVLENEKIRYGKRRSGFAGDRHFPQRVRLSADGDME